MPEPFAKCAAITRRCLTINIVGGPFDRITATLQEFEPGDPAFIRPLERLGIAPRVCRFRGEREVSVTIPARLHPTVVDMNRFNLERPGGGGIGCAIGVYFRARVRTTRDPRVVAGGPRSLLARHFGCLFQQVLDYDGGFEIEIYDHERRHVGMGSSIGSMLAAAVGINEVLERPFGGRELRRIVGYHSCEESPGGNGFLIPAFETGIGAMAGLYGGWLLATDDLELAYRIPLPDTRCIVYVPDVPSVDSGYSGRDTAAESEAELLLRRARTLDAMHAGIKAQMIFCDMLPAMIKGDLRAIGDTMFDLCFIGSKRAECEQHGAHGTPIYGHISNFRDLGAEVAGMSSVGPTVFALTRSDATRERILAYLGERGACPERVIDTVVDNHGARVMEDGAERPAAPGGWRSD